MRPSPRNRPYLEDLLCLSRADITTKRPEKKRRGIALIDELGEKINELTEEDSKQPPLPTGIGNALMATFGLPPSRLLGDIKRALEAAVEAGEIEPYLELAYVEFVGQHKGALQDRLRGCARVDWPGRAVREGREGARALSARVCRNE